MLVAYTGNSKMAEKTEYNTIFSNQFKAFYLRYAGEMILLRENLLIIKPQKTSFMTSF